MKILFILKIMLQLIGNNNLCYIKSTPHIQSNINQHNPVIINNIFQQKTKFSCYNNNYINNNIISTFFQKKMVSHPYFYDYSCTPLYKSRIQIENDSINISHTFYDSYNASNKTLFFTQLGMQNFLSKKIASLGGGKRYLSNTQHAIGYNAFFNFSIANNTNSLHTINVGGEYWYKNTLLMVNKLYNISHFLSSTKQLQENTQYKNSGYQIYTQTKIPHFTECTGKLKFQYFPDNKKMKNMYNNSTDLGNNYCLEMGINYYPIPIIGFDINNIFFQNKGISTVFKVLINYHFDIPIIDQISHKNKKNYDIINDLDITIHPFLPIEDNQPYIKKWPTNPDQEITGYPGEIKIINIDENDPIQWNLQDLQNKGGNISLLNKNTYAIYLPKKLVKKNKKITLTYKTGKKNCSYKQILIHIQDPTQSEFQNSFQSKNIPFHSFTSIPNEETEEKINTKNESIIMMINTPLITADNDVSSDEIEEHHNTNNTQRIVNINNEDHNVENNTNGENNSSTKNTTTTQQPCESQLQQQGDSDIPIAPPLPSISVNNKIMQKNSSQKISMPDIPHKKNENSQSEILSKDNNNTHPSTHIQTKENLKLVNLTDRPQPSTSFQNNDLSHLIKIHKKNKFSSVGTEEYMKKIEKTMTTRKKKKHFSEIEKIFLKLNPSPSSSSVEESYYTSDDSDI